MSYGRDVGAYGSSNGGGKRVSIALATYNGEKYIRQQLESFTTQTLLPSELVVTDDASTDSTVEIVRSFAETAPFPVRLAVNRERLGYTSNFFRAVGLCEGDIIALSDQDDVWLPEKIKTCVAVLERDGSLMANHRAVLVDHDLGKIGMLDQFIPEDRVVEPLNLQVLNGMGLGFTLVMRRELVDLVDIDDRPHEPEDPTQIIAFDIWYYLVASIFGRISQIHTPLALYRQHASNAAGSRPITLRDKLQGFFVVPLQVYRSRVRFSRQVSAMLRKTASRLPHPRGKAALAGAEYYDGLAARLELRARLFESRNLFEQLSALRSLIRAGAYRPKADGGLGRAAFVRDVASGVMRLGQIAVGGLVTLTPSLSSGWQVF